MPNDPLSPVKPGDPLPNRAETFNQVFEAVRAWRKKSRELPRGPAQKDYPPCVVVRVYNDTGATLDISDIVELGASLDSLTTDPLVVGTFPIVAGETPTAADIPFGILLDRIEANQIGRAVIYGSAVCSVEVNDPAHKFAVPIASSSAKLNSAVSGPVRIVSRESGSSGTKVAHVLVQQGNDNYSLTTTVSGSGGVDLTTTYASCSSSYTLAPGKYHMTADLAFQTLSTGLDGSNYLNIKVRLYDVTNAVELSDRNPYVMNGYETGSVYKQGMFPYTEIIDVDASTQVRFEAKKVVTGSPTTTFCLISSGYVTFHKL